MTFDGHSGMFKPQYDEEEEEEEGGFTPLIDRIKEKIRSDTNLFHKEEPKRCYHTESDKRFFD